MNRSKTSLTGLVTVPLLALTLAACGTNGNGGNSGTDAASPPATDTTTSTPADSMSTTAPMTSSSASSTQSTSTVTVTETRSGSSSTASSTTGGSGSGGSWVTTEHRMRPRTASGAVAPGWKTEVGDKSILCLNPDGSDMEASPFAKGKGVFTCGATAASLLACMNFTGGKVGCMQSADQKLVMFNSTLRYTGAASGNPWPIKAVLADGTVCTPMSHDQGHHIDDRTGWLGCGTNSELLTQKGGKYQYFNTSGPQWTAESVPLNGIAQPKIVKVKEIWFVEGQV